MPHPAGRHTQQRTTKRASAPLAHEKTPGLPGLARECDLMPTFQVAEEGLEPRMRFRGKTYCLRLVGDKRGIMRSIG